MGKEEGSPEDPKAKSRICKVGTRAIVQQGGLARGRLDSILAFHVVPEPLGSNPCALPRVAPRPKGTQALPEVIPEYHQV